MSLIDTSIDIDADVDTVWSVLTDLHEYQEWNPFIPRASAQLEVGGIINFDEHRPESPKSTYSSTIEWVDVNRRFGWRGGVKYIWLVEHTFELIAISEVETRLVHRENSRGLLVPFIKGKIAATKKGFLMMNKALKARAEQRFVCRTSTASGGTADVIR